MGKAKYAFVTVLPMMWLVIVTTTASLTKIFGADPRVGFLSHADWVRQKLLVGELPAGVKDIAGAERLIFNDQLNSVVAGFFLVAAAIILVDSIWIWWRVLSGRAPMVTQEVAYVATTRTA